MRLSANHLAIYDHNRNAAQDEAQAVRAGMNDVERRAFDAGLRHAKAIIDKAGHGAMMSGSFEEWRWMNKASDEILYAVGVHEPKDIDYATRLKITADVFRAIVDNGGGSFRSLIYGQLKFDEDAYVPLYKAGGMTITNSMDGDGNAEDP